MRIIDELIDALPQRAAVRELLSKLNENEAMDLTHEIAAVRVYYAHKSDWYPKLNDRDVVRLRRLERVIELRIESGACKPELSGRGSEMKRFKFPFGDTTEFALRYLTQPGWKLMHGEGGYVGIWLNEERLELYTYVEGDVVLYKASTLNDLYGELLNFDIDDALVA